MIAIKQDGGYTIYPKLTGAYTMKVREKEKIEQKLLRTLRRKKLPKSLEVSIIKKLLKDIKEMPEHSYNRKYNTY